MKTQFSEYPSSVWIKNKVDNYTFVRLRKNIEEVEIETEEGTQAMYEANEVEVMLPNKLANEEFVLENFEDIYDSGDPIGSKRLKEDIEIVAETVAMILEGLE